MQKDVARRYGKEKFFNLPSEARDVITDLAFNMGPSKLFSQFKGFLSDIRKGQFGEAAKELKYKNPDKGNFKESAWWEQVGGANTEEENLLRSGNRATSAFDLLTSLVNGVK